MAPTPTPQAQRSQEKKQHIYEVSMRMFRDKGYNQTTIRDICAAAGITIGTFYNFFGDKFGILQEHHRRLIAKRETYLEFTPEKLSDPYQNICDYFMSQVVIADMMGKELSQEFSNRAAEMLAVSISANGNGVHHIALFLGKALDAGSIPADTNPWRVAEYLIAGLMGIMQYWHNFSVEESMEDVARRMLPLIFAAVTDQHLEIQ